MLNIQKVLPGALIVFGGSADWSLRKIVYRLVIESVNDRS
jgi:hypothetical protein